MTAAPTLRCIGCGYPIADPDPAQACPECGAAIAPSLALRTAVGDPRGLRTVIEISGVLALLPPLLPIAVALLLGAGFAGALPTSTIPACALMVVLPGLGLAGFLCLVLAWHIGELVGRRTRVGLALLLGIGLIAAAIIAGAADRPVACFGAGAATIALAAGWTTLWLRRLAAPLLPLLPGAPRVPGIVALGLAAATASAGILLVASELAQTALGRGAFGMSGGAPGADHLCVALVIGSAAALLAAVLSALRIRHQLRRIARVLPPA